MSELTIRKWDHGLGEWVTVTVEATPEPRKASRRRTRPGRPCDLASLATTSPIPEDWRYTAYAPGDQLADTRSHIKPDTLRTHGPAITAWENFRDINSDQSEYALDDYDVAATAHRVFASITQGK
jgi:hypothetical protein